MPASHESTSAGSADGVDIVVVKNDARVGQTVNVRSWDLVRSMETNIIPTLNIRDGVSLNNRSNRRHYQIISNNDNDVRWLAGNMMEDDQNQEYCDTFRHCLITVIMN